MINLYNAQIEKIAFHRIGNKARNEGKFLAKEATVLNDEISPLLKEYYLKPFREKEENYLKFAHEVDLEFNEMHNLAKELLIAGNTNSDNFITLSQKVATLLFELSGHPHIKSGEVSVVYFHNLQFDNEKTDAIGIFKSEIKQDFLQFDKQETHLELQLKQGVNLAKLDKGALIFNTEEKEGYKVLVVDQNRYDTKYWLDNFLGVVEAEDSKFQTKKYLKMCQDFSKDVVLQAEDKKEELTFMNRAFDHFAKNDEFNEDQFLNQFKNPDLIPEFKNYKEERSQKYSIQDLSSFPIDNKAVSESRKKFKGVIELDTNMSIKMDFVSEESADKFLEKGWDEERQMYYYLCYFNSEKK
tara:strand:+ start:12573 stop:13637 length:1065 start_codon:yes stop_codon:yes gene_type:complete